jgi:hypothetical protein
MRKVEFEGGLGGGAGVPAEATVSGTVEAYIGAQAASEAVSVTSVVDVDNGAVTVDADGSLSSNATTNRAAGAVFADISIITATATTSGTVRAYVRDGVNMDAGQLHVRAGMPGDRAILEASATNFVISVSMGVTGAGVFANANVTGTVEGFIGSTNGVASGGQPNTLLDVNGPIDVDAYSSMTATALSRGGGGSLLASVTVMRTTVDVDDPLPCASPR